MKNLLKVGGIILLRNGKLYRIEKLGEVPVIRGVTFRTCLSDEIYKEWNDQLMGEYEDFDVIEYYPIIKLNK